MALISERLPLYVPAFGNIYEAFKPYTYPLLRVMMGLFYIPHGMQKLLGMFGAPPMAGYVAGFGKMGPFWGDPGWVYYIGCLELFGGIMMAIGFLTRIMAAQFVIFMAMATFVANAPNGWFWTKGGIEAPLSWGIVCLIILIHGSGQFSVDRAIGKEV